MVATLNRQLYATASPEKYATFYFALYDEALHTLTYTNAGHYLPMLVRADGSVERLGVGGPVLGVLSEAEYEQASITVGPGDRLVLYTDGLTEARDAADKEFGEDRLLAAAVAHRACSAPALQARSDRRRVPPLPGELCRTTRPDGAGGDQG
jgi:sigma-B regulation protein RsbU (phosphoserine phosphatase)